MVIRFLYMGGWPTRAVNQDGWEKTPDPMPMQKVTISGAEETTGVEPLQPVQRSTCKTQRRAVETHDVAQCDRVQEREKEREGERESASTSRSLILLSTLR